MKEDISLIAEYLKGDEEAIEELVRRYQKMIYVFTYKMVNDMEEAKDITQNTFIKAIKGIKGFKGKASFKTWLYRIALNTSLNHIREGRHKEVEFDETLPCNQVGNLSLIISQEEKNRIKKSVDKLPGQQRLAVMLRTYEGLSCKEASKVMECSESAVKAHYHFGVRKLRDILSDSSDMSPRPLAPGRSNGPRLKGDRI